MRDIERGRVLCTIEGYVLWKKTVLFVPFT